MKTTNEIVEIQGTQVGSGNPCYIIAEIGSNHNNNYNTAIELIDAAADAGVNAVKLQTFYAKHHYSKKTPKISMGKGSLPVDPYVLVESLEMNREWIPELHKYASDKSIALFSSPCDIEAINLFSNLDSPAYKVASFDLTDLNLIGEIAKCQKPVILSTGLSTYAEINRAIDQCYFFNNHQVILLQCTSLYPAPAYLSNLCAINTLKKAFNVLVGYSDHTLGDHICLAAVSLGASVIEKHFTLDANSIGPDHSFAIEPADLTSMIVKIKEIEASFGDGIKNGPREEEMELYKKARRSLHAASDILEGTEITKDMLCVKRPSYGVEPYLIDFVIGRKAKKNILMDDWISWDDI